MYNAGILVRPNCSHAAVYVAYNSGSWLSVTKTVSDFKYATNNPLANHSITAKPKVNGNPTIVMVRISHAMIEIAKTKQKSTFSLPQVKFLSVSSIFASLSY